MRVMVTGVAGFVGSSVARKLLSEGHSVIGVDCFLENLYSREQKQLQWNSFSSKEGIELVEHDLRTPLSDSYFEGLDAIINEAGMPGLMNSWADFETYSSCNLVVTEKIASAVLKHQIPSFVQISTSSVYGENATGNESSPTLPVSPYGVTKLAAEELLRAYARTHGLKSTILRYFSVYGPGQRPDMAYNKIIDSILRDIPINIYGDGEQSRTNTYIDDCATATVAAALSPSTNQIFNIAGAEQITLNQAITFIEQSLDKKAQIVRSAPRPGDQRHTSGDSNKAQLELGFKHTIKMREGLSRQSIWQSEMLKGNWITTSPWDA